MKTQFRREQIGSFSLYAALIAFLTYIMYQAPLISDDFIFFDLSFTSFSSVIDYVLHYGNGRVLGNLSVVLLVHHKFLCALVKALVVFGIIYYSYRIMAKKNSVSSFLVAFLLFLGITPELFGQTMTWTSGFMNYIPPILLFLVCYYLLFTKADCKVYGYVLLFVFAFMSCLYVEHCTVIYLFLSVVFLAYTFIKNKKQLKAALSYFAGCFLGTACMFLVPMMFEATTSPLQNYRTMPADFMDLVYRTEDCLIGAVCLYSCSTVLLIVASLSILRILKSRQKKNTFFLIIRKSIYIIYPIISGLHHIFFRELDSIVSLRFVMLGGGLALYLSCYLFDIIKSPKQVKKAVFICWFLSILSLAPFFIIRPFGERCMYFSYFFVALSIYYVYVYSKQGDPHSDRTDHILISVFSAALVTVLVIEFTKIGKMDRIRTKYIEQQVQKGAHSITIDEFDSRYTFETWLVHKLYYYEKPGDITFIIEQ